MKGFTYSKRTRSAISGPLMELHTHQLAYIANTRRVQPRWAPITHAKHTLRPDVRARVLKALGGVL